MKNLINYNLTTISIGIPSYNEESNILGLLESIIRSEYNRFDLCEIIISDNSTDSTPFKISKFMKSHSKPKIIFLHDKTRGGTANAWNNIIKEARGEIIVLYDADVIPSPNCTSELARKIKNNVGICASNPRPVPGKGIATQGAIFISNWLESVRNRQLSKYTVMGRGLSIRSDIAKRIIIPENVIAIDLFLQLKVLQMGFDIVFNPKALLTFKPAKTFLDFSSQIIRAMYGHNQLKNFEKKFRYRLSLKYIIVDIIHLSLRNPLGATSVCLCYFLLPLYKRKIKGADSYLWYTAHSTK